MTPSSFTEYALSGNLSEDEVYTVELLIERVRSKFDPYWLDDLWSKRGDARERPGYKPTFEPSEIPLAAPELEKLTWLSFQRIRESERAVRNLSALRFLPALTGLVLIGSDVSDISVLRHCKQLRRLELSGTPVRDLSSIEACHELEELNLRKTTIEDFSTLELLPKLRKLEISAEQTTLLNRLSCLPSLKQIELEELDSFRDLPTMPMLREIRGATVHDL